jgi:alpha-mannosidase
VWLWEWQEGAAEAISTFRTAVELCEANKAFVFNHNEAVLYKWVEEYEPELFKRIQTQVKAGKWNIMGGWYLQPDCNMPSGESFVRQILAGKMYFKNKFGVKVNTAINFDPFGHTRGLVQIMAKSGFDSYLFGRPQVEVKLPDHQFVWVGYDGSEVLATRFLGWYNTPFGKARPVLEQRIAEAPDKDVFCLLWGVGNHGGGPSRYDLKEVDKMIKERKDVDILHSTPQRYFSELTKHKKQLPRWQADLNPWGVGCYTSMIRVKQTHRLLENELYMVEKMAAAAVLSGGMDYPGEELNQASEDLMFGQFHDILPGSSIQSVEEASLRKMFRGLENVGNVKARAFFALSRGQRKVAEGQIPILVYNPHPYKVKTIVECEFNLADFNNTGTWNNVQVYQDGVAIPTQVERELSNLPIDWRKRVIFAAELEASQMNRFDCTITEIAKKPAAALKVKNGKVHFKTKELDFVINAKTGLVDRYRVNGVDFVAPAAFCPIVMQDNEDPWGMTVTSFPKQVGKFKLLSREAGSKFSGLKHKIDSVRVIEDGPVRSVVEVVMGFEESFICQRYKLPRIGTEVEVEVRVLWNQKDRMLKFSIPVSYSQPKYLGQVAFGVSELPCDGQEAVSQKWASVVSRKDNKALTCINDGIYGSDFSDKGLRLTLLRSPVYSGHPIEKKEVLNTTCYSPRIDQGERVFRFWFNAGTVGGRLEKIDREALAKNEKPFALSFYPSGLGKKAKSLAILEDSVVQISAIKSSADGRSTIIRLFEPTGKPRKTVLRLPVLNKKVKVELGAFEIKTLKIDSRRKTLKWVNLVEE